MDKPRMIRGTLSSLIGPAVLLASACVGPIDPADVIHDWHDQLAIGGSKSTSTIAPLGGNPNTVGTTAPPSSGGQTSSIGSTLNCAASPCSKLQNDYSATLAQATSCVKGADYTQCIGTRAVGLVCPCKRVINERQLDALARLTEIERAWAQAQCLRCMPNFQCGICVEQTISSAWGGCSPTAGTCEFHEW